MFHNSNVMVITRFQWLILAEGWIAQSVWHRHVYKMCFRLQEATARHPTTPLWVRLYSITMLDQVNRPSTAQWSLYVPTGWIREGADKSLARPGRKQSTATKLGIYSTCSPRSSIHFLARCSNFCKPLKKRITKLTIQPGLRGSNDLGVGRKVATFQLFFQSMEQMVVRRGQIRRIWWVIKTLEAQVGQFLLGCKCPVSGGIVVQEQDPLGDLPGAFVVQKSFNCTSTDE